MNTNNQINYNYENLVQTGDITISESYSLLGIVKLAKKGIEIYGDIQSANDIIHAVIDITGTIKEHIMHSVHILPAHHHVIHNHVINDLHYLTMNSHILQNVHI